MSVLRREGHRINVHDSVRRVQRHHKPIYLRYLHDRTRAAVSVEQPHANDSNKGHSMMKTEIQCARQALATMGYRDRIVALVFLAVMIDMANGGDGKFLRQTTNNKED